MSTLYTATKAQGQVMVVFYSSLAAAHAFAALQGRNVNGRELSVDFHFSQKDAQAGKPASLTQQLPLPVLLQRICKFKPCKDDQKPCEVLLP